MSTYGEGSSAVDSALMAHCMLQYNSALPQCTVQFKANGFAVCNGGTAAATAVQHLL